jgi:hypothetical protein
LGVFWVMRMSRPRPVAGRSSGVGVEVLGVAREADALLDQALVTAAEVPEVPFHHFFADYGAADWLRVPRDDDGCRLPGTAKGRDMNLVETDIEGGNSLGCLLSLAYSKIGERCVQPAGEAVLLVGAGFSVSSEIERHAIEN